MELTYAPEGKPARTWQFSPRRLLTVEAEAIESVGGQLWEDFDEFTRLFQKGNRRALRAALWCLMRREDPTLRFEAMSIGVMDIKMALGDDERGRIREVLTSVEDLDEEQRQYFVDLLGEDPGTEAPKDQLPSD